MSHARTNSTSRPRKASPAPPPKGIHDLSDEILDDVISYLPLQSDRSNLCRVSKLIGDVLVVPKRLGGNNDLTFYGSIIRAQPHMATLLLESWLFFRRFNDENSNSKIDERHFSVDENRIDFKIDTILKPLCRGTDTQFSRGPVELDNLLLSNITLGRSAYECLSIINLSSLKHLTIYRCERPDFFLHSLGGLFQHLDTLNKHHAVMRRTPPANRPRAKEVLDEYGIPMSPTKLGKLPDRRGAVPYLDDSVDLDVPLTCKAVLRSLRYRCDELTYFSKSGITVLSTFLRSFSGLELLLIQDDQPDDFDVASLDRHFDTLVHLYIGLGLDLKKGAERWRAKPEQLDYMFHRASNIQQLALSFPRVHAHSNPSKLEEYLVSISQLPNVRILRMLNWPRTKLTGKTKDESTEAYQRELKENAEAYQGELAEFADGVVRMLRTLYSKKGKDLPLKLFVIGNNLEQGRPLTDQWLGVTTPEPPVCFMVMTPLVEAPEVSQVCRVSANQAEAHQPGFDPWAYDPLWEGDKGLGVEGFFPKRWTGDESYTSWKTGRQGNRMLLHGWILT